MSTSATRIRRARLVDTIGVLAVVAGMVLGLVPGIANAEHTGGHDLGDPLGAGVFEIDGDVAVNSGGHDWSDIANYAAGGEQVPGDDVSTASLTDSNIFTQSQTEATYPNWTFQSGNVPGKADLDRLFVASQVGAQSYVWLGASRVADEGNVQVTAEFNKDELTTTSELAGDYRQVGDFFIRFNFPGNSGAPVDVYVAEWSGSAWVNETQLQVGTDFRSAVGTIGNEDREFVELEIDLTAVLWNGGLPDECESYGTVSFRTEASGGNNDNNDPTLKDVAGPFAIDLDTCGEITVEKVDEDDNGLADAEFTLYEGSDTSGSVVGTCTTDVTGTCSFGTQLPGTYTIDETAWPEGYRKASGLPETQTTQSNTDFQFGPYTDPRIPYTITVEPDATNALDDTDPAASEHEFLVTLSDDEGGLEGEVVNLAWTGSVGEIVRINEADGSGTACTTDADGQCTVVVNTTDPGGGTLSANWDTPYQNTVSSPTPLPSTTETGGTPPTTAYPTIADSADKNWVGLDASIEADGLNLLGDPHTFTVHVWEVDGEGADDGTEAGSQVAGATVDVSWSGPAGSSIVANDCADNGTGSDGTCTVTVDSDTTGGTGTVTIDQASGTVTGGETAVTTFDTGERTADKTWRIYRASIDDDSVNPVGQSHTFNVTVEYSDDNGSTWSNPGAGITVDWDGPTPDGSNDFAQSTCDDGTDVDGECTIVVTHDEPGQGTVTVTAVDGDLLLDGGASDDGPFDVTDVAATKTWLDFTVDIDGPFINLVGEPETFTVTVQKSDGGAYQDVPNGTVVLWSDSEDSRVTGDTCSTGTVDGECTITVTSSTPGTFDISVTGLEDYAEFDTPADVTFTTPAQSSKTWVEYRAFIEEDGVNLVGDDHTFTITAQVDDGTGWSAVDDGTVVTVTDSGLAASVDDSDCADGTTGGTCEVVVDSAVSGTVTITVGTVSNETAVDSPVATVDVSDGTNLDQGQSTSADKTWIEYRATIEASDTNLTGEDHVFTVTAEQNDGSGSGWELVPDGTDIDYSTDNDGTVQSDTCDSTSGGQCTITVDSSIVTSVTVTIDSVSAEDVDGTPSATVANGALSAAPEGSLDATKDWIEVVVTVEADETNVVGENHVFTIDVDLVTPSGNAEPTSGTLVATTSGVGSEVDQSCDDGLATDGTCTVEVASASPGDRVVTAETLTFDYDGKTFTDVDLDGAVGVASNSDLTATKTWRAYRVDIEADGLNMVRDDHTFDVVIEQTDDGDTWTGVPDGTTATLQYTGGEGSITGGTCTDTGTVDGECTVVVSSESAGTGTVTVTDISVDLPEEQRTDIDVDVTNESASKTWIAFRGLISDDSVNVTGDSHDFTLTAQYTTNGSDWVAVPDGSEITFESSGVGSVDSDDCDSTAGGDCTVTVVSTTSGDRVVEVTGVDPAAITVDVGGTDVLEDFGLVDLADDTATGVESGTDVDVQATKTWASYTLRLTPVEAVNLLDGSEDDPEQDHVITVVLDSDDETNAPVAGQDVRVTLSGDTGTITDVEDGSIDEGDLSATCTTADDGTCDVTITSSSPGTAVLSGSYEATIGDSEAVTVESNDAEKIWTTFRVTVEADAINVVGNPHTFTVTVEQSNPEGDCDGDWCAEEGVFPTIAVTGTATITDNDCVDNGTGADGTCTVTITSDAVQTVTLTATYEASVGQTSASFNDTGEKTWVDFDLTVDPPTDENLVGTDHVFTVTISTTYPMEEGTQTDPVVDAVPTIELDGLGAVTDNGCADGTDAEGQCLVTISSSAPGGSTLTASYLGTTDDDQVGKTVSDSGDKLWVDYQLVISDDAVNVVGDEHVFTATLSVDTGEGFGPAAGETLAFTFDGVGAVTGGDVDGDLNCVTDATGTCDIAINSDEPGASNVGVSYGAEVGQTSATYDDDAVKQWIDIDLVKTAVVGDGFGDGDLVEDPETGLPTLFFTSSDQGPKTAVFEYLVTNTGPVTLQDVVLTDDRLGTIIELGDGVTLEPGESTTVRATEQYTYQDAAGGLNNIITNIGVVTANDGDGNEVDDTDDAVIQLIAQQSSILIDLVKDVVAGEGDVENLDGIPTVSWSEDEFEAGESKVVRYRFTVTNVGPSPIVDVELTDPMFGDALISLDDGVTLQPGESTVVEVDHQLTADQAFPDGPTAGEVPNVATATGANETRDAFDEDTDDAIVFVQVVFAEVEQEPEALPATGLTNGGLLPLSMLLITVGVGVLWLSRRRETVR